MIDPNDTFLQNIIYKEKTFKVFYISRLPYAIYLERNGAAKYFFYMNQLLEDSLSYHEGRDFRELLQSLQVIAKKISELKIFV